MMKVKLIRQFKNHPAGSELDVSHRIYNYLLSLKVIERPKAVPLIFGPDVLEASEKLKKKKPPVKKKPQSLGDKKADRMVRERNFVQK